MYNTLAREDEHEDAAARLLLSMMSISLFTAETVSIDHRAACGNG